MTINMLKKKKNFYLSAPGKWFNGGQKFRHRIRRNIGDVLKKRKRNHLNVFHLEKLIKMIQNLLREINFLFHFILT